MTDTETDETSIDTDAGPLYAKRWTPRASSGTEVPIVLVHDSLGCVTLWRDFPERLAIATGHPVIAYDRLGFGRSAPYPGILPHDFTTLEALTGFRSVREHFDLDRFAVLGHSAGGDIAVACSAAYRDACCALITIAAVVFVEDVTLAGVARARAAYARPGQLDRLKKYHGDKAAWVLSAWIDTWLSPEFAEWTLDDALNRVRCPVLPIHGALDEFGSIAHPQRIAALTGAAPVILEQCGHVPHREQADAVLALVAGWLAGIMPPSDSNSTADSPDSRPIEATSHRSDPTVRAR